MALYDIHGNVLQERRRKTAKAALQEAVAAGVNLLRANLYGANLTNVIGIPGVLDWRPTQD